jgi:hypothetical protein
VIIRVFRARLRPGAEQEFMLGERELLARTDVDGLLGASIGRRLDGSQLEVVTLTVWRDRAALERFAEADIAGPVFRDGADLLVESWTLDHYDAADESDEVPEVAGAGVG